jgi:hypothetical protein
MGKFRKVETVDIDGFELEKKGTLTIDEEEWIEQFFADLRDGVTRPALELGEWIAGNEGKTPEEAMEFVEGLDKMKPAAQMATLSRYGKVLPELIDDLLSVPKRQQQAPASIVTEALNWRLPEGWIAENRHELREDLGIDADGSEWLPEWTGKLGKTTVDAIYDFIQKERYGWLVVAAEFAPAEEEDAEEQTLGEDLPPLENGSPPTGGNDGPLSPLPELAIPHSLGVVGVLAPAI